MEKSRNMFEGKPFRKNRSKEVLPKNVQNKRPTEVLNAKIVISQSILKLLNYTLTDLFCQGEGIAIIGITELKNF